MLCPASSRLPFWVFPMVMVPSFSAVLPFRSANEFDLLIFFFKFWVLHLLCLWSVQICYLWVFRIIINYEAIIESQ